MQTQFKPVFDVYIYKYIIIRLIFFDHLFELETKSLHGKNRNNYIIQIRAYRDSMDLYDQTWKLNDFTKSCSRGSGVVGGADAEETNEPVRPNRSSFEG